jgi:hypothetical protein
MSNPDASEASNNRSPERSLVAGESTVAPTTAERAR